MCTFARYLILGDPAGNHVYGTQKVCLTEAETLGYRQPEMAAALSGLPRKGDKPSKSSLQGSETSTLAQAGQGMVRGNTQAGWGGRYLCIVIMLHD